MFYTVRSTGHEERISTPKTSESAFSLITLSIKWWKKKKVLLVHVRWLCFLSSSADADGAAGEDFPI